MTSAPTNTDFPETEEVMDLYEELNRAHEQGQLTRAQWEALLGATAEAETAEELSQVRNQLEENTNHEIE